MTEHQDSGTSRKRGWRIAGILAAAAVIVLAAVVVIGRTGAAPKSKALLSLTSVLEEKSTGLDVAVSVGINGQELEMEGVIWMLEDQEPSVTVLTLDGLSLYYAEGAIVLEDGTAYRLIGTTETDSGAADAAESSGGASDEVSDEMSDEMTDETSGEATDGASEEEYHESSDEVSGKTSDERSAEVSDGESDEIPNGTALEETEKVSVSGLASVLDYGTIPGLLKTYYGDASITAQQEGDTTVYSIVLDEEDSLTLLSMIYAPAADIVTQMGALTVDLYVTDDTADAIVIAGEAETDGMQLTVYVRMNVLDPADAPEVPEAVFSVIKEGAWAEAPVLTDELLRLLTAWNALCSQDVIGADLTITADCGLFAIDQEVSWIRTYVNDTPVNGVTILGRTYYFTDEKILGMLDAGEDGSGDAADEEDVSIMGLAFLLETAYEIFQQGGISFETEGESTIFTVNLTQEQMEQIIVSLIPDAEDLDIAWHEGGFELIVTNDMIESLCLTGGGSVTILFVDVSVTLTVDAQFMDAAELEDYTLPQSVLSAV